MWVRVSPVFASLEVAECRKAARPRRDTPPNFSARAPPSLPVRPALRGHHRRRIRCELATTPDKPGLGTRKRGSSRSAATCTRFVARAGRLTATRNRLWAHPESGNTAMEPGIYRTPRSGRSGHRPAGRHGNSYPGRSLNAGGRYSVHVTQRVCEVLAAEIHPSPPCTTLGCAQESASVARAPLGEHRHHAHTPTHAERHMNRATSWNARRPSRLPSSWPP